MTTLDKFDVLRHLGSGFFGDVFLCFDPFLEKEIAVKVIDVPNPDTFVNAINEGRTLDSCRHKHIVDVKDVRSAIFATKPVVIIVMEYLANGSVQKAIEDRFVSTKASCQIIQQALLGLEHAHNNNVLHRDVKPANILFGDSMESKLSDFGFAINYHRDVSNVAGYRPHQPLEVILGQDMDKSSDIYAMGITFYRLLNNIRDFPFPFSTEDDWIKAVRKDVYPSRHYATHIPDKICRILNKAINKEKSSRFRNCTLFRQALEKLDFFIDWNHVNDDYWEGYNPRDSYSLQKVRRKSGWIIDFKRNNKRRSDKCYTNISDENVDNCFFKILRETNLN